MAGLATSHGAKPIMWDSAEVISDFNGAQLFKNIIIMVWQDLMNGYQQDYQYANAGYKIIQANLSAYYFDQIYTKDCNEIGLYYAGFFNNKKVFDFVPFNVGLTFRDYDIFGDLIGAPFLPNGPFPIIGYVPNALIQITYPNAYLTDTGIRNILGLEGEGWGERRKNGPITEYMIFPKTLCLAERAWRQPLFHERITVDGKIDSQIQNEINKRLQILEDEWQLFGNALGKYVLPQLDAACVNYRIDQPGGILQGNFLYMNNVFPGLIPEYSFDNKNYCVWSKPVEIDRKVYLRSRTSSGRYSRIDYIDFPVHEF